MEYRDNYSLLGFGCMRLPNNYQESEQLILKAIEQGINYFDTAYVYSGNEELLGKILAQNNCRDKVMIASKIPHYLVKKSGDFDSIFDTELKRLQTNYLDNYLIHMLPDIQVFNRLKKLGIIEWLNQKKAKGQIKKVGFSFHGNSEQFIELLKVYPWDFAQIQYNYLDEHTQAGRKGLLAAHELGIKMIIMEPLRGGNLINLNPTAMELVNQSQHSSAYWGLNWLFNQKEISCVLSGMKTLPMLEENIQIASNVKQLTAQDYQLIEKIKQAINSVSRIGCTGCQYCQPCPQGVDIPGCFSCYNVSYTEKYARGFREYLFLTTFKAQKHNASLCIECGLCERKCPQHLPIRNNLKLVKKRFENPVYQIVKLVSPIFFKGDK